MAALLGCGAQLVFADTIQLKDAAAVTGKILAEKPDSLVVDVGYTVLVIPRSAITGITKAGTKTTARRPPRRRPQPDNFIPPTPRRPPRAT